MENSTVRDIIKKKATVDLHYSVFAKILTVKYLAKKKEYHERERHCIRVVHILENFPLPKEESKKEGMLKNEILSRLAGGIKFIQAAPISPKSL